MTTEGVYFSILLTCTYKVTFVHFDNVFLLTSTHTNTSQLVKLVLALFR